MTDLPSSNPASVDPLSPAPTPASDSIFEQVGGATVFFRLVDRFYAGVETDPLLRPLYPEDLGESSRWTALFLIQFCGGPGDYSASRGHPRLRLRHLPFSIGRAERDAWMHHMRAAVEAEIEHPGARAFLLDYFERTATFLINRPDEFNGPRLPLAE